MRIRRAVLRSTRTLVSHGNDDNLRCPCASSIVRFTEVPELLYVRESARVSTFSIPFNYEIFNKSSLCIFMWQFNLAVTHTVFPPHLQQQQNSQYSLCAVFFGRKITHVNKVICWLSKSVVDIHPGLKRTMIMNAFALKYGGEYFLTPGRLQCNRF